jgi:nitroreductase
MGILVLMVLMLVDIGEANLEKPAINKQWRKPKGN